MLLSLNPKADAAVRSATGKDATCPQKFMDRHKGYEGDNPFEARIARRGFKVAHTWYYCKVVHAPCRVPRSYTCVHYY